VKGRKFLAKKCFESLDDMLKSSNFAPAFERETRMSIEMMETEMRLEPPRKNFFEKKTSKKFWQFKNSPYLCIRFRKESLLRRVL